MRNFRSISSRRNRHVRRWTSLLDARGIRQHQQCLVSGGRLRQELVEKFTPCVLEILVSLPDHMSLTSPFTGPVYLLTADIFHTLDIYGTKEPLLVCQIPPVPPFDLTKKPRGLELLCPMGDPGNLGGMLRGCRAFGADRVILLSESVHPFHPKVIRASSGAVFSLPLHWGPSVHALDRPECAQWITALDMKGIDIGRWTWPEHIRLLIGEEGKGIPPIPFAHRVKIPQTHDSIPLNACVAGHIALYAYRQVYPS